VIHYFAVTDDSYPRNKRIREYLSEHGFVIRVETIDPGLGYRKNALRLLRLLTRPMGRIDAVFLAEFSLQYAWIAWLLAKRKRAVLVVDWFVGLFETRILDYAPDQARTVKARTYRAIDKISLRLADLVITDTDYRAQMLVESYGAGVMPTAVPVGAPSWARPNEDHRQPDGSTLRVLYYGNYIPLHGVLKVIHAMSLLPASSKVMLTLVGRGHERTAAEELVKALSLEQSCNFVDPVPEEDLANLIHANDVVLGIFGDSEKARSVVANKVWQGLAAGAVVVTQASPALTELAFIAPDRLRQIEATDESIAHELAWLSASGHATCSTVPTDMNVNHNLEEYVRTRLEIFTQILAFELTRSHRPRVAKETK